MRKLAVISLLFSLAQVSFGQLSGALSGTLGPATYYVVDSIYVNDGDSLQILPGTTFLFGGPYPFEIYGTLLAEGTDTSSNAIVFTTDTLSNPDRWRSILFLGSGSSGSRLTNCIIKYSAGGYNSGGGIHIAGSSPTFTNCIVSENSADNSGGGIYCTNLSFPIFTDCILRENRALNYGGGICTWDASPTFLHCIITGNIVTSEFLAHGGGAYCAGEATFTHCTFRGNSALRGGGLWCGFSSVRIMNCTFSSNIADKGGGVFCNFASPSCTNCTFHSNEATYGGGVYNHHSSSSFSSTIISFSNGSGIHFHNSVSSQIDYCDIFGNSGGNYVFTDNDSSHGPANIGLLVTTNANGDSCDTYFNIHFNPMFVDAATDNYNLLLSSPCIDAGDAALPLDPDGTVTDIGAFYYHQGFHHPSAFNLISPEWGDTCWTLDTVLVWQTAFDSDSGDTVTYEVWLDTLPDFSTAWEVNSELSDTTLLIDGLSDDQTYYWTIHASDLNTYGTWADDTLMFSVYYLEPPNSFALASPQNGETGHTTTPTLLWHASSDPDPDDFVYYRLMWSYDSDFSVYEDTMLHDTSFTFPEGLLFSGDLTQTQPTRANTPHFPPGSGGMKGGSQLDEVEDDSTVYWKVQAIDGFGLTTWCEPEAGWYFHVYVEESPNVFDLLSPPNGDTIDALVVELIWEASSDPDIGDSVSFYRIYLALDSTFSTGLDSQQVSGTEMLWGNLDDDQTYWWRVRAFDTHGNGVFSNQSWCFHTYYCELPSAFALLEPADSLILTENEVTCRWQQARDPDPGDTVTYTLRLTTIDTSFSYDTGTDTCWGLDLGAMGLECGPWVEWWVEAHSICPDTTIESESRFHFYPPSAVSGEGILLPTEFALHQNYPNPFNPTTTIRYDMKQTGPVSVKVFDLLGREVATLASGTVPAGSYTVTWNAADLPSGIYLCRMEAPGFEKTRKLMLVK